MPVKVDQIIRCKRKTLALIVKPDGTLIVRVPLRTPVKSIREFIEHHIDWAKKKQAEALAARPPAPKQYIAGEMFLYLGNAYPLEIVKGQRRSLIFEDCFKLSQSTQREARSVFERWYRKQAQQILTERVCLYAQHYDFQYKRMRITSARTRWGSCSADGSLNFSWRLILAPLEAVDYVVVHELVHTLFHDHSKRFWKKVEEILPDYKERKKWLRKNGQQVIL